MRFQILTVTAIAATILLGGCVSLTSLRTSAAVVTPTRAETLAELNKAIEFNQSRVTRDPQGAIGFAMLSEAYLAVARLNDDDEAAHKAELAARRSLEIRTANNGRAARRLTEALLAQHRFVEARESAELAMQVSGNDPQSVRQFGEVLLELGDYPEFRKLIGSHGDLKDSPEGLAMMARWHEVIGEPSISISLLKQAIDAVGNSGPGHESVLSWYQAQLGWAMVRNGDLQGAKAAFESALQTNSLERKALAGMAKIAFDQQDWKMVIALSKEANSIAPLTDVMGWEVIALEKLGKVAQSDELLEKIQKVNQLTQEEIEGKVHVHGSEDQGAASRHTHSRLYSRFLADWGRHLEFAHHAAEEDLQWRKDIHAYDTFAWATYRFWLLDPKARIEGDGLLREAQIAIKKALSTGTKDAEIVAHSREILTAKPRGN